MARLPYIILSLIVSIWFGGSQASTRYKSFFAECRDLPREVACSRVDSMLNSLANDAKNLQGFLSDAETLLANPYEPTHDEQLWLHMLTRVNSMPIDEQLKSRQALLLEMAQKNAVGTKAHTLRLTATNGSVISLDDISADFILLFFNDPECDACEKVKLRLDTLPVIKELTDNGTLAIVGIYPGDNVELWQRTPYPACMISTRDNEQTIDNDEAYVLPTMPLFYLLDGQRTVLLKNEPSLNAAIKVVVDRLNGS